MLWVCDRVPIRPAHHRSKQAIWRGLVNHCKTACGIQLPIPCCLITLHAEQMQLCSVFHSAAPAFEKRRIC